MILKKLRDSNENEMILEFLKGELNSARFNEKLRQILYNLKIDTNVISDGNLDSEKENALRKIVINQYRGYPNNDLFYNFPHIYKWEFVEFDRYDLENIFYIDYDYWNELSSETSKPKIAAINITNGLEVFGVSNKPFLRGTKIIDSISFPPIILITCNNKKFLIIEGHSRTTIYALRPDKFEGTFGFVGYCSIEDMQKYDSRMI